MKYIDSEKLKADIENLYDNMLKRIKIDKDNSDYWAGKADAYRSVIDTISSFQQEHPDEDIEEQDDDKCPICGCALDAEGYCSWCGYGR